MGLMLKPAFRGVASIVFAMQKRLPRVAVIAALGGVWRGKKRGEAFFSKSGRFGA